MTEQIADQLTAQVVPVVTRKGAEHRDTGQSGGSVRISGVSPPPLKLPAPIAVGGVQAARLARLPLPVIGDEVRSATLWWTYRNTKARRELGFRPRPHEQTLEDAVAWQREQLGGRAPAGGPQRLALRALGRLVRAGERLAGR